jgi:hypothetical protein
VNSGTDESSCRIVDDGDIAGMFRQVTYINTMVAAFLSFWVGASIGKCWLKNKRRRLKKNMEIPGRNWAVTHCKCLVGTFVSRIDG